MTNNSDLSIKNLKLKLENLKNAPVIKNQGRVLEVKDGVIILDGLSNVMMMERVYCEAKNISAVTLNLQEDKVGAAVIGNYEEITEDDVFETTGEILAVEASSKMLGRVVDGSGKPIDGTPLSHEDSKLMLLEKIAAGVIERQPVKVPLQTGILAIDAATPIGRGQRQLIIGDRGTGKTAIAVDTIINQRNADKPVVCIYCSIGQKNSRIAALTEILNKHEASKYTIIVNASASSSVAEQYLAPYTATAIGEYFLEQGKDVLIVYDDLTKHAWAYRQLSLVLRRPAGREAYPGDIFYLHSRLLERSCRLNDDNGGGSITSLPIVETQFGDVSAYIPTNIISITDGQIYVDTDIFNSNIRPAVDVRNSVSRVGGEAQIKEMKKASGKLRLEIATFKELEVFAQFGGSDLDPDTKQKLERGKRIIELLRQKQYNPYPVSTQIALLTALNEGYLDTILLTKIEEVRDEMTSFMSTHNDVSNITDKVKEFFSIYSFDNKDS